MFKKKIISIQDISVMTHLGVDHEEREKEQEVLWTIQYVPSSLKLYLSRFKKQSKPYICYKDLTLKIIQYSKEKEFLLIEELALFCYKNLKKDFPQLKKLSIKLKKVSPPLAHVQGGVQFEYGDNIS